MVVYKKVKSLSINGKKKSIYSKEGTAKLYVKYKSRYMSLTKYKKMKAKISGGKCRKVKKCKKSKSGKSKGKKVCRKVCK